MVAPPGDQRKLPPGIDGVAVSVAVPPGHMVVELTLTVGAGLTDTVPLAVVVQPDRVYVTV